MNEKVKNKIFESLKVTILLSFLLLFLYELFEAIGTSSFFGIKFQMLPLILLIFIIISFISNLKDVE